MIKGFTKRANDLLTKFCQDECLKNGEKQILPETVILCILKNCDSFAYKILESLNINFSHLQSKLEIFLANSRTNSNDSNSMLHKISFSRRLQTMLDVAVVESRTLRCRFIGTEHFLIASCREDNSIMSNFICENNISIEDLRKIAKEFDEKREVPDGTNSIEDGQNFSAKDGINENKNSSAGMMNRSSSSTKSSSSFLSEYSKDLIQSYKDGLLDPIYGRDKEIRRAIEILERRTKNNPILVGEPGVGKTAIVEGLAIAIAKGLVSQNLLNKRILVLDLASIIAGTKFRGEFEDRIKRIIKEVKEKKDVILFIDEIHTIIGAGSGEGSLDAANILKPALSRGEIQCIGATTQKEYRKYFERDGALERRFQPISVKEPSEKETVDILNGIKSKYEQFHGIKYKENLMEFIVKYSQRYITNRFLPDKVIDVLDEAGAVKKIKTGIPPSQIADINAQIEQLTQKKEFCVRQQDFETAAVFRNQIADLKQKSISIQNEWKSSCDGKNCIVDEKDICKVISNMTGIPVDSLDKTEIKQLQSLEDNLHKIVVGQNEAISLLVSSIRRSRSGVSSKKRPTGSFVFLGPTGVGKTLLAKALAKNLFGTEDALIRVDMSDYMEKHNVSRLVGAPPGYVGYDEGGSLTEQILQNPYSVVLFDEIEKAHKDIFNLLLQVLEEGELKDNLGHVVNFRNTVIIMTSNAGVRQISTENQLGFSHRDEKILDYKEIKDSAINELKNIMNPELLNRLDEVLVFHALNKDEISKILDLQIEELSQRLSEQNLSVKLKKSAREYLIENGYEPSMGARPMRRLIQRDIENEMANFIIAGKAGFGDCFFVDYKNGKLVVKISGKNRKNCEKNIEIITDSIVKISDIKNNVPDGELFSEVGILV
ncbi:MAG: ATP-dependent Clp protease ATP-binding subunit [Treponemataceae bacterium]